MKIHPVLFLSGALLSFGIPQPACGEDLLQLGNITINPTPGPATLTLHGPAAPALGASGFEITHVDDNGSTFGLTDPVSVGKFRLLRPLGFYQWYFTEADGTTARPAMELSDDHSLLLHSSLPAERAVGQYAIELQPGHDGGVFFNGARLASPGDLALSFGGGSILRPATVTTIQGWPLETPSDGLLAAGPGAVAFGAGAVAVGRGAVANFNDSVALGSQAVAKYAGMAFGRNAYAEGGTAIGQNAHAYGNGVSLGFNSWAQAFYATAVGTDAWAGAPHSLAFGGWASAGGSIALGAWADCDWAWAGAWGRAEGLQSIALGGNAYGARSFAGESGVSWGDYSITIGRGTVAQQQYEVVLGAFSAYLNTPSGSAPGPTDPILVIGNGWVDGDNTPQYAEHRSNAFTVGHDGAAWVQGGLTVEGTAMSHDPGGPTFQPAPSLFKGDVSVQGALSVQGVLRVPESGDLSMGAFTAGTPPLTLLWR